VGDSRPDWQIIIEVSNRFGLPMEYESPEQVFEEIASVTPSYAGISYGRLEGEGLCWPVPDPEHPGTACLHVGKFARGRGAFAAIDHRDPAELTDDEYPLWLTTGRAHVHYHTGTMTRNSPTLHAQMPEGYVEINPEDAAAMGIQDGDLVKVASRRGEITAPAVITGMSVKGLVFVPFHFIEASANVLTNPALDPICAIPEYKVCAVKVEVFMQDGGLAQHLLGGRRRLFGHGRITLGDLVYLGMASAARMARLRTSSATTAKPGSGLTGPGGLHRRVEGQKVGLEGDLIDGA
jgi:formate dehydrogenase major subunit